MAERHPGWVSGIDAFEARLASGFGVVSQPALDALDPVRVRPGIKDTAGFPGRVSMNGNTKVLVNPFQAVITNSAKPAEGPYLVTLDSIKELVLDAASQALSRIDLIVAEVNTTSAAGFEVKVLKGPDSNTTPLPVSVITNPLTLKLAEIKVPAGGAAPEVSDSRKFTGMATGILPVLSADDRPANAPMSMFVYRLDTGVLEVQKSGVGWTPYRAPRADNWHVPTLLTGWKDYGGGWQTAAYTRNSDGWIMLRGLIKEGSVANGAKLFLLDPEFRPKVRVLLYAAGPNSKMVRLDIYPDGYVTIWPPDTPGGVDNSWLSLDGITFAAY